MLETIEFTHELFMKKDDNNICNFTENTVIICNNYNLMNTLAKEILDTINGNTEYNDYWCDEEDVGKGYMALAFGLQRVIKIGNQTITIGLEPSLIHKADKPEDIWLFSCVSDDVPPKYKIYIYIYIYISVFGVQGKTTSMGRRKRSSLQTSLQWQIWML